MLFAGRSGMGVGLRTLLLHVGFYASVPEGRDAPEKPHTSHIFARSQVEEFRGLLESTAGEPTTSKSPSNTSPHGFSTQRQHALCFASAGNPAEDSNEQQSMLVCCFTVTWLLILSG